MMLRQVYTKPLPLDRLGRAWATMSTKKRNAYYFALVEVGALLGSKAGHSNNSPASTSWIEDVLCDPVLGDKENTG